VVPGSFGALKKTKQKIYEVETFFVVAFDFSLCDILRLVFILSDQK
jgi:hypothetical protein